MILDVDPRVDFAFKRLFGVESNTALLMDLLNAVLAPPAGREIVEVTLIDPFNLREFAHDKLSIVDVKAVERSGRRFLVEMQLFGHPSVPKRALFYWAKNYCGQLRVSEEYVDLQPVVVIAFLNEPLYPLLSQAHQTFRLREATSGMTFTDDLEIHTIELSKFTGPPASDATKLDRWVYFLTQAKGHEMSHFPREMLVDPIFQKAFEELERMSGDPTQRAEYERRLGGLRDEKSRLSHAMRQGYDEGRNEGEANERHAALKHQIGFLEQVLRLPSTPAETLDALPLEELARMTKELEQRCLADAERRRIADSN